MKQLLAIILYILANSTANGLFKNKKIQTTADRIRNSGYPAEVHTVRTSDAYILKMFRIPCSSELCKEKLKPKPVVFLQHGLLSSSDSWILSGPNNALAFLLAKAGYDVWMGNARGNTYSRKHANISEYSPEFWNFSWHEIGMHDLPAMIDYVLNVTNETALHYVGYSQGTTAFMVLLSSVPHYVDKIKTTHMFAPVAFMENMQSPLAKIAGPLLGHPTKLSKLIGSNHFMPTNEFLTMLTQQLCVDKPILVALCSNIYFLIGGWDSKHYNLNLLPDAMETHPAGASTSQFIHYLQLYESGRFRRFDYGKVKNQEIYNQETPKDYVIENIKPIVPMEFYYSDNDYFVSIVDLKRLVRRLGPNVRLYRIKYHDWNHLDYLLGIEIKEIIYDRVIRLINQYENRLNNS